MMTFEGNMKKTKKQSRVEQVDVYTFPSTHKPRVEVVSGAEQYREFEKAVQECAKKSLSTQEEFLKRLSLPAIYPTPKTFSRAKKVSGGVLLGGTSVEEILVTLSAFVVWIVAVGLVVYVSWFKGSN